VTIDVRLLAQETIDEPYSVYAQLRSQPPQKAADLDLWVVSAYDDLERVLLDTQAYSNEDAIPPGMLPPAVPAEGPPSITHRLTMLNHLDGPDHHRIRNLARKLFSQRAIKQSEGLVRAVTERLADALPASGEVELMSLFARPLPTIVIAEMLGIPAQDTPQFIVWSDAVVAYLSGALTPEQHLDANVKGDQLYAYIEDELVRRSKQSGEPGILSELAAGLNAGDTGCTLNELVSLAILFLVGGNETSAHAIGFALRLLSEHPEFRARAVTDHGYLARVCDESMRLYSPSQGLFRRTSRDVELGGVRIPKGERLVVLFGSANRDETRFPAPTESDPGRDNLRRSMTFGWGVHRCLGEHLAKMEVEVAIQTLLRRYPQITLATGREVRPWNVFFLLGNHELWVDLGTQ
jgi:cytochrome P450